MTVYIQLSLDVYRQPKGVLDWFLSDFCHSSYMYIIVDGSFCVFAMLSLLATSCKIYTAGSVGKVCYLGWECVYVCVCGGGGGGGGVGGRYYT